MQRLALPVFFCFYFVVLSSISLNAQNSVGIGTNTPNQNAVLELVSTNGDQGLLVPKLTTSQRTASTFVNGLTSNENGLLVYDSDENQFYYWQETQWQPINTGGGDADSDPQNEIQDLQLAGNTLTITNNGSATPIDLSGLAGVDSQTLAAVKAGSDVDVSISNGNSIIVNVDDNDSDPGNELQVAGVVPVTPTGNLASTDVQSSLEELQGDIDLDLDQDPSNEIQNISISGNSLGIDGGGLGFDLTPLAPSANQVLKWDGVQWIAGSDDTGVGTLPALANAQILTNNGSNIAVTISGDLNMNNSGIMTIQPDAVSSTEIVNGSIDNLDVSAVANISATKLESTVVVQGENVSQLSNDSGYLTTVSNADIIDVDPSKISQTGAVNGEVLKWNNGGGTWEPATDLVDDADNNSTNEIQDLSLGGNTLSLTNDITPVDLSPYLDNTDSQNAAAVPVTPSGNLTSADVQAALVELQGDIDTDTDSDPTNEYQDLSIATDIISLSNSAGTINLVPYLDNTDSQNAADVPVTPSGNLTSADVQAALVELQGDIDTDTDSDPTNEFQDLSLATDIISLSNSAGTINLAPYLDNTDSQNAVAVPVTPSGNLTSVEVQAALEELQGDIDLDTDTDNTNEFNLGGSLEANNILRVVDAGGNTDIDISRLTGDLDANINRINNLVDPALAQDAATKAYVDNEISSTSWGLTGNAGTNPVSDYIGTTDAQDLVLGTNGAPNMRIFNANGDVSIGPLDAGLNPGFGPNDRFLTISSAQFPGTVGVSSLELSGYSSNLTNEIGRLDFDTRVSGVSNLIARVSAARVGAVNQGELRLGTHNGTSFTNHVIIDETGNVGIGSANPATKLDVTGTMRSTGFILSTSPTNGYVMTSNAGGVGTWQPVPSQFSISNFIPRGDGSGLVQSDIYNDGGTGNVVIGSTNAFNKFSVVDAVGTSTDQGTFVDIHNTQGQNNAMAGLRFKVNSVTTNQRFGAGIWHRFNPGIYELVFAVKNNGTSTNVSTSDIKMVIQDDGNVGIGTLTPANTLDVNGSISTFNDYKINNEVILHNEGIENIYLGVGAGTAVSGDENTFIGSLSGNSNTADGNSFFGSNSGFTNTSGSNNAFSGSFSGYLNSTGSRNSFHGHSSGYSNTIGVDNTMIGYRSGFGNTSGIQNVFIGPSAGGNNTNGSDNIAIGYQAGQSTGFNDFGVFIGTQAGNLSAAPSNTMVGHTSGNSTTTGGANSFFGSGSGPNNTSGQLNAFLGAGSGNSNLSGNQNTFVGALTGLNNSSGSNNTALGYGANIIDGTLTNASAIGASARINRSYGMALGGIDANAVRVGIGTQDPLAHLHVNASVSTSFDNKAALLYLQGWLNGDAMVVSYTGNVGIAGAPSGFWEFEVNGAAAKPGGGTWTDASDRRIKQDIKSFPDGLEKILAINPVSYRFKEGTHRDPSVTHIGVIAQEIEAVLPYTVSVAEGESEISGIDDLLIYDGSSLPYVLINAVKELHAENEDLKDQLRIQREEISNIYSMLKQMSVSSKSQD